MTGFVRNAATAVLLGALCSPAALLADESLDVRIEATFTADNNVTRAHAAADKLSDRSFGVTLNKSFEFPIPDSPHTRLLVSGSLGSETFQTYKGLSRIFLGVQGELQYRPSAEFDAPTFAAFVRSSRDEYESTLRDGYRNSVGVSVRKSVTDRIDAFGALAFNKRDGKSTVFDTADRSARVNLDYSLSRNGTIYLGGEYRRGDIVSTAPATLLAIDLAKALVRDDAFTDTPRIAYRLDARSVLATFGYNLAFGNGQAFDVSWRRVRSASTASPGFVSPDPTLRYYATQLSASYLIQF
jgi:hypothetical protein